MSACRWNAPRIPLSDVRASLQGSHRGAEGANPGILPTSAACGVPFRGWVELMRSDGRLDGGPGWYIDRETLLPVIEDVELFRTAHADDPAVEVLVALWTGRPEDAEKQLRLKLRESDAPRWRALLADALRDQGRTDEAIATYEALVAEVAGTAHEAVMRQHLGKSLFVAGYHAAAARAFERALSLRLEAGADEALVESSRVAVARARAAASAAHST